MIKTKNNKLKINIYEFMNIMLCSIVKIEIDSNKKNKKFIIFYIQFKMKR